MNAATPDQIGATTGFGDCLADPGELTRGDAIKAMSRHHNCSRECLPLQRAGATLNTEYSWSPSANVATDLSWGVVMSTLVREAIRLSGQNQHRPSPGEAI
ncbi:hypothetical protein [Nocardia nepalensis]|uniref:hypothetical protein n=1 Tax=Nocardia nepalensis TaxID=3375448 RepID=UPI003B67C499